MAALPRVPANLLLIIAKALFKYLWQHDDGDGVLLDCVSLGVESRCESMMQKWLRLYQFITKS